MTKILTSIWVTLPIGVMLYLGATVFFWKSPAPTKPHTEQALAANLSGPSWDFLNPEADQLMTELRAERKALDKRGQELNDLATRLQSEKAEMNQVTQAVHQTQMDMDNTILRVQEEETANLKKLAKVYSNMSSDGAAKIFAEMDDQSIVKILLYMKESETAAVLESLSKKGAAEAKRAADLSERVRTSVFRPQTPK